MRLVFGLVVRRVEVAHTGAQAGLHDGEILIRESQVHHEVGAVALKESDKLVDVVGVHLCGLYGRIADGLDYGVALGLRAAGYHDVRKYVCVLSHFMGSHGGHAAGADD